MDYFIHSTFLGSKKVKVNVSGEKIVFGAHLSNWSAGVYELVQVT